MFALSIRFGTYTFLNKLCINPMDESKRASQFTQLMQSPIFNHFHYASSESTVSHLAKPFTTAQKRRRHRSRVTRHGTVSLRYPSDHGITPLSFQLSSRPPTPDPAVMTTGFLRELAP